MARETRNPDRAGKDMDMDDTRRRDPCPDCRTRDPDDHAADCRYAED